MWRTGYVRSWERVSDGGTKGGPLYMFMRMTIGSSALPINIMGRYKGRADAYLP